MDEHCKELMQKFSEYLDGEACDEECQEILKHIEECECCKHCMDTLKYTKDFLNHMPRTELPDDMKDRLKQCLKQGSDS